MNIDIILISNAKSEYFHSMTKNAIKSAGNHTVYVVESNPQVQYDNAITIHTNTVFR